MTGITLVLARKHVVATAILAGVVLVTLAVDWWVVTDDERIARLMDDLESAVERGDANALMQYVSEDYASTGMTRDSLSVLAAAFFDRYGAVQLSGYQYHINRSGDLAIVGVAALATPMDSGSAGWYGRSVWELQLQKDADREWRITSLTPLRIGQREVDGWDKLPSW